MNTQPVAGEGVSGRIVILTQFGDLFGQALLHISSQVNETIQLSLGIWKFQIGTSLTFTLDYINRMTNDDRSNKEVIFDEHCRLYHRFIGFEGVGVHLSQFCTPNSRSEVVSLGLHPLTYGQLTVETNPQITAVSAQLSFANLVLESKLSFLHASKSKASDQP